MVENSPTPSYEALAADLCTVGRPAVETDHPLRDRPAPSPDCLDVVIIIMTWRRAGSADFPRKHYVPGSPPRALVRFPDPLPPTGVHPCVCRGLKKHRHRSANTSPLIADRLRIAGGLLAASREEGGSPILTAPGTIPLPPLVKRVWAPWSRCSMAWVISCIMRMVSELFVPGRFTDTISIVESISAGSAIAKPQ